MPQPRHFKECNSAHLRGDGYRRLPHGKFGPYQVWVPQEGKLSSHTQKDLEHLRGLKGPPLTVELPP